MARIAKPVADAKPAAAHDGWSPHDFEGAPLVPAEAQEDLLALKSGAMFVCARPDGDIRSGRASGEGLYAQDTRHLSQLRLTIGGQAPVLLSSAMESGHRAVINATNPALHRGDELLVAQETLNIRRTVLISDRLHYRVCVRNFQPRPVTTTVELSLAADFADVFEARGIGRRTTGRILPAVRSADTLCFAYVAADGERRQTLVALSPWPARCELVGERAELRWELHVEAGEAAELLIDVQPIHDEPGSEAAGLDEAAGLEEAAEALDTAHRDWVHACPSVRTDNDQFNRFIDASVRDLHALMLPLGDGELAAAGIPWYVAPFGRDSLLTALESLMMNPAIARGTLLALAWLQADADDPWRDAEPGKILHELRRGELARTGQIPHTPYYGTVDATPLFVVLAAAYYRWTLDLPTMRTLRPALDAALRWIDEYGDGDGDGFVEYERRSPAGLVNHGWKDSFDAVVHADGTPAAGPIALAEVQGYVYEAKQQIAGVYEALGDDRRGAELRAEAAALRRAFNEAFWDPPEQFYCLALDGRKAQVRSVTSNVGHCLYCGIVDDDRAAAVAERLMAPDMFSGWGIRTLSSRSRAYNPMSYHNGSVWPHDNAIVAAGLKRYGFDAIAAQIAGGMFDVARGARDFRLPELFCGFGREESRSVVAYPVACIPQAWAAASPFLLLQALLGISADAPDNRLSVNRPRLPEWLGNVEIRGIRVARSRVSLSVHRTAGGGTGFALLEQQGDARVTMSA